MKIGILSMHRILNYGSFFQAYSLKRILESLGHEVVFVDYKVRWTKDSILQYKEKSFPYLRMLKRMALHRYDYNKRKQDPLYKYFQPCYEMLGLESDYHFRTKVDVLIIGSDEVFNCLQKNVDVGYSLELFGKNNRAKKLISFAASFGDTTLEKIEKYHVGEELGRLLSRFDAISVRDQNSAGIVQHLCGTVPLQHMDPALLANLENDEWKKCPLEHFMIVYGYYHRFSLEEGEAISSFASKRGLKLLILNAPQSFGDTFIRCRPDEMLGYFKKAEYVITDTFHGTIFSVIYHKPMAIFCRTPQNTTYSNENKLLDLVDKLGLRSQLVTKPETLPDILDSKINFDVLDDIRNNERDKAIEYLRKECGE